MNTATIIAEINKTDIPLLELLLKKFKAKSIKIEENDPTKMTKEEFFSMINRRENGGFKKMSRDERKAHLGV